MKHLGTKRIETDRLVLRRFALEDAKPMFENWASDPEVTKYLTWPAHDKVEVSAWVLEDWISHYEEERFYQWAIVPRDNDDKPIGSISVVRQNNKVESMEIGYCIGEAWWHKGIMTEALKAVMAYLFEEVGANRVSAVHDPNNPHSGGVMRKCGMTFEGTTRRSGWNNQGICDESIYAILKEEYEVRKNAADRV